MFIDNARPGQLLRTQKLRVMNRTGGTRAIGDVVALDMTAAETETSNGQGVGGATGLDVQDAIFQNVVGVAAANKDGIVGVVSNLLSGAGADNTEMEITLLSQRVQCEVESTTDIAKGDRLYPDASQTYLKKLASAAADQRAVAYALEARTANDAGLIDVCFFGGLPYAGGNGD